MAPAAAELIERILSEPATLSAEAGRITAPMVRPDLLPDILIALREQGIAIDGMNVQKPSLDEVFLTITGKPADPTSEEQAA
jgi:ABC-2 type transport system ATP-binding protein